jgi:Flp pilus assembly pilin Flp
MKSLQRVRFSRRNRFGGEILEYVLILLLIAVAIVAVLGAPKKQASSANPPTTQAVP